MRGYVLFSLLVGFAVFNPVSIPNSQLYDSPPLDPNPPPPPRQATVTETYTEHEWWLLRWSDNELVCRLFSDTEVQPGLPQLLTDCGAGAYQLLVDHPICDAATYGGDLTSCAGLYLHHAATRPAEREVLVDLPSISVSISINGCQHSAYKTNCSQFPVVEITSNEPLPDHIITEIHYQYRVLEHICEGAVCIIPLLPTTNFGEPFSFWADSSFGDSSDHYQAYYRVRSIGDGSWQVDLISDRLSGIRNQAASLEWQSFPPLGENPEWLSYPKNASALASNQPYQYLAGQLIQKKIVDTSSCTDNGLQSDGYANQCGLEKAADEVIAWQNRFDVPIFTTAERFQISPQLLKNIIAQESQFWPGLYAFSPLEYGLARLMETGADTLFRWNDGFYTNFCSQVLWDEVCASGYDNLAKVYQEMLRGALATRVNVYCESCEYGFDLERADYGIEVLAQSLLANAAQVEQMFENLTDKPAGESASYEDLWRFTLVDYNAGSGCLSAALQATVKGRAEFTWSNVAGNLVGRCRDAIGYVENITK